jgi:photosynthetic reaction center cytochrome c subunit
MKTCFVVLAFSVGIVSAQTPEIAGVWKADLEKSKITPAPKEYLMILEQKDSRIMGTVGVTGQRGEERSSFNYNLQRPSINSVRGIPMRTKASWEGNTLVVDEHVGGAHPGDVHEKYTLSPDGKTLTLERTVNMNGREMASTIVFEKQPESAAEALRKPEETAGAHYKNVTVMKDVPASQFIDAMRSFTFALGVNCEFCHEQGNFASDAKRTKTTARHMIEMTRNINETAFHGQMRVRCFTCHQGHEEPVNVPE